MKFSKFGVIAVAASMGLASFAQAQPHRGPDPRPGQHAPGHPGQHAGPQGPYGPQMRPGPNRAPQPAPHVRPGPAHGVITPPGHMAPPPHARGIGPNHQYYKGQRLPREWRHKQNVVNDWRGHRLSAPPRGQQWVQVGADYALVAIATGVITALILNN